MQLKKENAKIKQKCEKLSVFKYPDYNCDTHNGCDGIEDGLVFKCSNNFVIARLYKNHEPLFRVEDEIDGYYCIACAIKLDKKYPGMDWG